MSYRLIDNETNEDIIDKLGRIRDERDKYKIVLDKIKEILIFRKEDNKNIQFIEMSGKAYLSECDEILKLLEEIE